MNNEPSPPYDLSGVIFPCTRPLRRLRRRLLESFPKDTAEADARFSEIWDFDKAYPINGSWLTYFAETTAQAMIRRDASTVDGHLVVILQAFQRGGSYLRERIDVNYVEDLFFEVEDADAQWGWQRVPTQLRQLYIDMWGDIIPQFVDRLQPSATIR